MIFQNFVRTVCAQQKENTFRIYTSLINFRLGLVTVIVVALLRLSRGGDEVRDLALVDFERAVGALEKNGVQRDDDPRLGVLDRKEVRRHQETHGHIYQDIV
jgi:hypothetical protein